MRLVNIIPVTPSMLTTTIMMVGGKIIVKGIMKTKVVVVVIVDFSTSRMIPTRHTVDSKVDEGACQQVVE